MLAWAIKNPAFLSFFLPFVLSFFCLFVLLSQVSLCSPGCPGTHSLDQAGLKLTKTCLPLPPKSWDQRLPPPPSKNSVFKKIFKEIINSHYPTTLWGQVPLGVASGTVLRVIRKITWADTAFKPLVATTAWKHSHLWIQV